MQHMAHYMAHAPAIAIGRSILCMALLALPAFLVAANPAGAQQSDPAAERYTKETGEAIIQLLKTYKDAPDLRKRVEAFLLPRIDTARIARFVLGPYARKFSKVDLDTWEQFLITHVSGIYTERLRNYTNQNFVVLGSQTKGRNSLVMTAITFDTERPPLPVQWWFLKDKQGNYKLFDLQILGIWFAQEQRDLFVSILSQNQGKLSALMDRLKSSPGSL